MELVFPNPQIRYPSSVHAQTTDPTFSTSSGRFSVKSILPLLAIFLITVACAGCSEVHPTQRGAVSKIEALGGKVLLNDEKKVVEVQWGSRPVGDADLEHLSGLETLEILHLGGTDITGNGLAHIASLTNLKKLNIGGAYQKASLIDDNGLKHLANLNNLEELVLSDTQISDDGLANLSNLKSLQSIYLFQTNISDEGLQHLEGLSALTTLRVMRTKITDEGAEAFHAKMPNLKNFVEAGPPASKTSTEQESESK